MSPLAVLLLASSLAVAQSDPREPPAALELVVRAELRLSEAQEGLHRELRDLGYRRVVRLGPRTLYLNRKLWKPRVTIHEEGLASIRGQLVLPLPAPGTPTPPSGFPGIPSTPPVGSTVQVTGITQHPRAVKAHEARVAERLMPWLAQISDARWERARGQRELDLRAQLVGIWLDGVDLDGRPLRDHAARRQAIVHRWLDTAPGPAGAWARAHIEDWIDARVQPSGHPFTDAEVAAANAAAPPDTRLDPAWSSRRRHRPQAL